MFSFRWLLALKLFLPSWNFFNDFGAVTRVEVAFGLTTSETSWQPVFTGFTTSDRRRCLFNPAGNRRLQEQSLIERAADELSDERHRAEAEAFIARAIRARLASRTDNGPGDRFRFRVVERAANEAGAVRFVSGEFPLNESEP